MEKIATRRAGWAVAVSVLFFAGALIGCEGNAATPAAPAATAAPATITLRSPDFGDGQPIPPKYSADGQNMSPPLEWGELPTGTRELAVVMEDSDSPQVFIHWIVYKIPPTLSALPAGGMPAVRVREGTNSAGRIAYAGPRPTAGQRHRYLLTLYAVDTLLDLSEGATLEQLNAAMKGHVVGRGRLAGTFPN